jgi:Family of unknown function (DUF5372)
VCYFDAAGALKWLPTDWTSVREPDPFSVIAAGRAYFRPADLWAMVQLIRGLHP